MNTATVICLLTITVLHLTGTRSKVLKLGSCVFVMEPEKCDISLIQFHLFTRSKGSGEIVAFEADSDNLTSSTFQPTSENKIIVHGFNADINLFALQNIKTEYLKEGDYNVWMMDWSSLSGGSCYPAALHNVYYAGQCLATAIQRLRAATQFPDVHVIGFSLGAHVPQAAAKRLRPYVIDRVTGLEAAMPGFLIVERNERLSKSAGKFVDVFHTNGLIQGLIEPLGHVDFYFNGGVTQPGCYQGSVPGMLNCDHVRAAVYFAESINSAVGFWGYRCNFASYMLGLCRRGEKPPYLAGEHVDNSTRGLYIVETNKEAPFAKGNW